LPPSAELNRLPASEAVSANSLDLSHHLTSLRVALVESAAFFPSSFKQLRVPSLPKAISM